MSLVQDVRETEKRFQVYIEALRTLFLKHGLNSSQSVWSMVWDISALAKNNKDVQRELTRIFAGAAKLEGGKLSLTTLGILIGASIGGIGIAGMGSAIGIPALAVTALCGVFGTFIGNEIDSARLNGAWVEVSNAPSLASGASSTLFGAAVNKLKVAMHGGDGTATSASLSGSHSPSGDLRQIRSELGNLAEELAQVQAKQITDTERVITKFADFEKATNEKIDEGSARTDNKIKDLVDGFTLQLERQASNVAEGDRLAAKLQNRLNYLFVVLGIVVLSVFYLALQLSRLKE